MAEDKTNYNFDFKPSDIALEAVQITKNAAKTLESINEQNNEDLIKIRKEVEALENKFYPNPIGVITPEINKFSYQLEQNIEETAAFEAVTDEIKANSGPDSTLYDTISQFFGLLKTQKLFFGVESYSEIIQTFEVISSLKSTFLPILGAGFTR